MSAGRKRNPIARDLRTPKYRPRVVRPRKGKGSYRRKPRNVT
jgi:alternative ribosome-rescue factor